MNKVPLAVDRSKRQHGIDVIKGILIVLVVFGHTFLSPVSDNFIKWLIYGFHMPAFLFISGYLVNLEKLGSRSFLDHIKHYFKRLIFPWLIVSIFWKIIFFREFIDLTPKRMVVQSAALFFAPSYHLWFIPSLYFMLTVVWLLSTNKTYLSIFLFLTFFLTIVTPYFYPGLFKLAGLPLLGDRRNLQYLFYFILGFWIKKASFTEFPLRLPLNWHKITYWLFFLVSLLFYLICFWLKLPWLERLAYVVMNTCLLVRLPSLFLQFRSNENSLLNILCFLGQNTLWIYLLHPFATYPLREFVASFQMPLALIMAVVETILIVSVAVLIPKVKPILE